MTTSQRAFGIELELLGLSEDKMFSLLKKNKIPVSYDREYNKGLWRAGYDGSLQERFCTQCNHKLISNDIDVDISDIGTCELVSPILKGKIGLNKVKKVTDLLNKQKKIHVNSTCGFHVHVSTKGLNEFQKNTVFYRWFYNEKLMKKLVHKSRLNSEFAQFIESEKDVSEIFQAKDHYDVINLSEKYDTIEFRIHHGTYDTTEIINWVQFCVQFVDSCKNDLSPELMKNPFLGLDRKVKQFYNKKTKAKITEKVTCKKHDVCSICLKNKVR